MLLAHFTIVKTLKTKNEAEQNIKNFIEEVETQKEVKVKAIRADNGGEFVSNTFKVFCMNKGIALEYTMPHTPQENGTAERMNRTLLDKIRTKIIESAIPKTLWCEALKCSVYELNRLPTKALQRGMTPSQIWTLYPAQKKSYGYVFLAGCLIVTCLIKKVFFYTTLLLFFIDFTHYTIQF